MDLLLEEEIRLLDSDDDDDLLENSSTHRARHHGRRSSHDVMRVRTFSVTGKEGKLRKARARVLSLAGVGRFFLYLLWLVVWRSLRPSSHFWFKKKERENRAVWFEKARLRLDDDDEVLYLSKRRDGAAITT